ncbi:unnamed protein product [Nesidiocoris tenuis]|uniref:Uncharacterized protein n=1 Tax=Nesidiocoris tenuis TaxID=355587 RepID=A0A6H5H3J7_9HEMI|nr:unnamed protein product [Nesidiocoris tenuis]
MNRQGLSCSSTASSIESSQQAPPNSRDPTATPSPAQTPRGEVRGYYARTPRRERKPALRARRRGIREFFLLRNNWSAKCGEVKFGTRLVRHAAVSGSQVAEERRKSESIRKNAARRREKPPSGHLPPRRERERAPRAGASERQRVPGGLGQMSSTSAQESDRGVTTPAAATPRGTTNLKSKKGPSKRNALNRPITEDETGEPREGDGKPKRSGERSRSRSFTNKGNGSRCKMGSFTAMRRVAHPYGRKRRLRHENDYISNSRPTTDQESLRNAHAYIEGHTGIDNESAGKTRAGDNVAPELWWDQEVGVFPYCSFGVNGALSGSCSFHNPRHSTTEGEHYAQYHDYSEGAGVSVNISKEETWHMGHFCRGRNCERGDGKKLPFTRLSYAVSNPGRSPEDLEGQPSTMTRLDRCNETFCNIFQSSTVYIIHQLLQQALAIMLAAYLISSIIKNALMLIRELCYQHANSGAGRAPWSLVCMDHGANETQRPIAPAPAARRCGAEGKLSHVDWA